MKKFFMFMAMVTVMVALSSCVDESVRKGSERILAWQNQVSHYFGKSVYSEGNIVVMTRENGVEETFVVTKVDEGGLRPPTHKNGVHTESKYYSEVYVFLKMKSSQNMISFLSTNSVYETEDGGIRENLRYPFTGIGWNIESENFPTVINNMDVTQPTITVMGKNGMKAVFVRDEGLRQLTDTLGHTWTRK